MVRAQQRLGLGGQRARLVTLSPRILPLAPITIKAMLRVMPLGDQNDGTYSSHGTLEPAGLPRAPRPAAVGVARCQKLPARSSVRCDGRSAPPVLSISGGREHAGQGARRAGWRRTEL